MKRVILPGATIGVLGSGQLGRMMAIAARRMGYRVHTLSPGEETPTGQVADLEINADYEDLDAIRAFAKGVRRRHLRVRERLDRGGGGGGRDRPGTAERIRPAHHATARAREGVSRRSRNSHDAVRNGPHARRAGGRDGLDWRTGDREDRRVRLRRQRPAPAHVDRGRRAGVESRGPPGSRRRTRRRIHARAVGGGGARTGGRIRRTSGRSRTRIAITSSTSRSRRREFRNRIAAEAVEITRAIMEALDYVGVLCVEFFLTTDGRLLVNEIAPRPHNSGHLTVRCVRHQPVRAAGPRRLRPSAGFDAAAAAGGDGQSAGRPVGQRRARLVRRPGVSRREAAPVRQGRGPPGAEDGPSHRAGRHRRRSDRTRARARATCWPEHCTTRCARCARCAGSLGARCARCAGARCTGADAQVPEHSHL